MEQPRRPDQSFNPPSTVLAPGARAGIFRGFLVVVSGSGPNKGIFVYSGTPRKGNLVQSTVAVNGTDPYGNSVFAGTATYAPSGGNSLVITLLSVVNNAFFQYANPSGGLQGALISSLSSAAGTDPVTSHSYVAGFYGIDPVFGDTIQVVGANINLNQTTYTRSADLVAHAAALASQNPYILVDAPEQTTALHMQQLWQGASPDGTKPPQLLIGQVAGAGVLSPVTSAMVEIQGGGSQNVLELIPNGAGVPTIVSIQLADTVAEWVLFTNGEMEWGSGSATRDVRLQRSAANTLQLQLADFDVNTVGRGLQVAEGSNAKQGRATLVGGSVVVANTSVTATSIIVPGFVTPSANAGALFCSAKTAGTGFTIKSTNAADTSVIGYEIFEIG